TRADGPRPRAVPRERDDFFAVLFFAGAFVAGAFFVGAFFVAAFFVAAFFVGAFFAGAFAGAFFAGAFFAGAFFAGAFFVAAFFAGAFFVAAFFAAVLAGAFVVALPVAFPVAPDDPAEDFLVTALRAAAPARFTRERLDLVAMLGYLDPILWWERCADAGQVAREYGDAAGASTSHSGR
ncbi:MAG: hypothetical protein ACRDPH_00230, partial [Marmoricola sp.]